MVLNNGSADCTDARSSKVFPACVASSSATKKNLGLWGNLNRCLDFAPETEFLQILHADDTIEPEFYEVMTEFLANCPGRGLAWSLDARMDENSRLLSVSGKADGGVETPNKDIFLRRKAELAFCATLLKTAGRSTSWRARFWSNCAIC